VCVCVERVCVCWVVMLDGLTFEKEGEGVQCGVVSALYSYVIYTTHIHTHTHTYYTTLHSIALYCTTGRECRHKESPSQKKIHRFVRVA
jgi:hypothetical protein